MRERCALDYLKSLIRHRVPFGLTVVAGLGVFAVGMGYRATRLGFSRS